MRISCLAIDLVSQSFDSVNPFVVFFLQNSFFNIFIVVFIIIHVVAIVSHITPIVMANAITVAIVSN